MRRLAAVWASVAALAVLVSPARAATSPVAQDRIWFAPGPGTMDYLDLFEHPEEWPRARQLVNVFKFYQQHTQTPAPSAVGPNTYDALVRADAFHLLTQWGIKTAIEVGAVKDFYCTPDASGMDAAIAASVSSIQAVQTAGGTVSYLSMDDPFAAGKAAVCGGPAPDPTADRVAIYTAGVHAQYPGVQIGMSEAYPLSSEPLLESILDMLKARGVPLAFLHADVDSRSLPLFHADFVTDMRALQQACAARGIAFGILIWGYNGGSDALYAADVDQLVTEITAAFTSWSDMPDNLVVQSFAQSSTGLFITPSNLTEDELDTHTYLLRDIYHQLRGENGPVTGVAIRR